MTEQLRRGADPRPLVLSMVCPLIKGYFAVLRLIVGAVTRQMHEPKLT
jgi:hypothetical protein